MSFKVMCFSWNAAGLRICETASNIKAGGKRKGIRKIFKSDCVTPDFFGSIRSALYQEQPGLVIMCTQDEDKHKTYFHSDFLPNVMPEIGYNLVKRDKLDNVGNYPSGVPQLGVTTGHPDGGAIRISIYARDDVFPDIKVGEKKLKSLIGGDGQKDARCVNNSGRKSGATASYIWHPIYGKFAFINIHLPESSQLLYLNENISYKNYRVANISSNKLCLLKILNQLVDSMPKNATPDHIFLLGDLNTNISSNDLGQLRLIYDLNKAPASKIREYQRLDELKELQKDVLEGFKEGPSNEGALFAPTYDFVRGRPEKCKFSETTGAGSPDSTCYAKPFLLGWHDRILYKDTLDSQYLTHCIQYNRLDIGNINESTHAGVTGLFELRSVG